MLKIRTSLTIVLALTLMLSIVTFSGNYVQALSTDVPQGYVRIGVVGDIDCKSSQTKQFDVMKKYNVQYFFSGGDYAYSDGQCVLDNIKNHGWDGGNEAVISCGNHDSCGTTRDFNGMSKNYGSKFFESGKIAVHVFDGNNNFGSGSTQYNTMKQEIESSDAWYNFALIHQPFATAKSKHDPNGQFSTYQPIFKDNGVQMVLQAHNHNTQRFNISGVNYVIDGAGWHDSGASGNLYSINSNSFNGNPLLFGNDNNNGFLLLDVKIDDSKAKKIIGTWMTDGESVKDSFTIKQGAIPEPPPECPIGTVWDPISQTCVEIPPPPKEICGDGIDNDGDGQIDEGCIPPVTGPFNLTIGTGIAKFVPDNGTVFETQVSNGTAILPVAPYFNITVVEGSIKLIPFNQSQPIFDTQVTNGTLILPKP